MLDNRINTFISVCNHMNYTAAARELNLTQPAVSQHISWLSKYYGVKLFTYENKRLELTEAGKLLFQAATTLKSDERILKEKLRESQSRGNGSQLRLGATMTVGDYAIIKPVEHYIKNHSHVNLYLTIANTDELLSKLKSNDIDLAIIEGYFPKEEYDSIVFSSERYIPICATNSELARQDLTLRELTDQRLLLREKGSGTRDIMEKNFQAHGMEIEDFPHRIEVNSLPAIVELVKGGCGVTFLYEAACREEIERGSLREIKLSDFTVEHDFTFLWNKGSIFEEEYRSICEELLDIYRQLA